MTTEQRKEELENKFRAFLKEIQTPAIHRGFDQPVFDWFYSHISELDKEIEGYHYAHESDKMEVETIESKIQRLEEIIKAADEVIYRAQYLSGYSTHASFRIKFSEALEHYNKLKSKLPSGI